MPQYPPPASKDRLGSLKACFLRRRPPLAPSSPQPLPRPLSSSLRVPPHPQHPSAQGLSAPKSHLPQTQSLEAENGGPWPEARLSHHRGRWLGRKAEVRKWPAPRRQPFLQKRSRSLRPDVRTVPSVFRAGEGKAKNIWSFVSFPVRTVLVALGFCSLKSLLKILPFPMELLLVTLAFSSFFRRLPS